MALRLVSRPFLTNLSPLALQVVKTNVPAVTVALSRVVPNHHCSFSQVAKAKEEEDDDNQKTSSDSSRSAVAATSSYKDPFDHPFFTKGFDEFFNTPFFRGTGTAATTTTESPFDLMPVFSTLPKGAASILRVTSPGFEIHQDEDKYSIAMDVPDIKVEDMEVRLEHDGRVLHVSGGKRLVEDDNNEEVVRETRFDKRFTIGDNVDTDNIKANLHDGVLTIVAPQKEDVEKKLPKIPITEGLMNE